MQGSVCNEGAGAERTMHRPGCEYSRDPCHDRSDRIRRRRCGASRTLGFRPSGGGDALLVNEANTDMASERRRVSSIDASMAPSHWTSSLRSSVETGTIARRESLYPIDQLPPAEAVSLKEGGGRA